MSTLNKGNFCFFLYIIVDDKLYVTLSYILLYCLDSIVMSAYFEQKKMMQRN